MEKGASPSLHGDTLVVPWDHEGQSYVAALSAKDGNELWKVDRDEPTTWATPLITEFDGRTQVIMNGSNRVRSYDLADGSLIWECGGQVTNPIPTPIRDGDHVIVMTGYQGYAVQSIALNSKGDVTDSDKVRWSRNDSAPYIASGVMVDDRLYFTKSRDAIISSVNTETGDVVIDQERLSGLDSLYASLASAGGYIYAVGRNGTTCVIRNGDQFEVVATNELGEGIDASPAFVGNSLLLRGAKHLYCISIH
ncbi:MAG: PQQ-binding-like beta-propeller repeat protein [Pirellulaceae bacterium]